jgi:hypothetical protein
MRVLRAERVPAAPGVAGATPGLTARRGAL